MSVLSTLPAYARPQGVADATASLAADPGALPLAGGTDLMNQLRLRMRAPSLVVDTADIPELHRLDTGAQPVLGAGTTIARLLADPSFCARYPALAQAGDLLGGPQIQALATVGGNLCNGSPAAETATPLLVYDATAVIANSDGISERPLDTFWLGAHRTVLGPGDLLVELRLPGGRDQSRSVYRRMELRRSVDIALASVAAVLETRDGQVDRARVALGAVAPVPLRVPAAEGLLEGLAVGDPDRPLDAADTERIARAADMCAEAARPIDDVRASAGYRRAMLRVLVQRTVLACLGRDER